MGFDQYRLLTHFEATKLGVADVVLGLPWLHLVDPDFNFRQRRLTFDNCALANPKGTDVRQPVGFAPYYSFLETARKEGSVSGYLYPDDSISCAAVSTSNEPDIKPSPTDIVPPRYHRWLPVFDK